MTVKKGQIVLLKPEFLDLGEVNVPHIALDDAFDGRVTVEACVSSLPFKPINIWETRWIAE